MTIKRKTQLNLSGSHRNLDADFAHIGSTLFVTGSAQFSGSVNVDDVLSASGNLSTAGTFFVQGGTQLSGAVNIQNTLSASSTLHVGGLSTFKSATFNGFVSASNMFSTANNLQVGQNAFVTGSLQVTGSIFAANTISGSTGRFTYLSGALSASSTGLPFIVAGSGITTTFAHDNLNWTIAATGGGSIGAGDTFIQFNQNGAFAGSASFTHTSGTLGVHAISGSLTSSGTVFGDIGYNGNILKITGSVLVTQSLMLFDGVDSLAGGPNGGGGILMQNGGQIQLTSGSFNMGDGVTELFAVRSSRTAGEVDIINNGINIKAMTGSVTTGPSGYGGNTNILSSSLLTRAMEANCVGKFDISVLGAATGSGDFISADIVAVASKSSDSTFGIFGITERNIDTIGTNAASWDVNINNDGGIAVTGSGGTVRWYGQVTKMMILSGSDDGQTIVVY